MAAPVQEMLQRRSSDVRSIGGGLDALKDLGNIYDAVAYEFDAPAGDPGALEFVAVVAFGPPLLQVGMAIEQVGEHPGEDDRHRNRNRQT